MKVYTSITILLLGLCLVVFGGGKLGSSQAEKPASDKTTEEVVPVGPQPKIVLPEQSFDFGFSPEGFFLVHPFIIRNEGEADLIIERVRTTCGCTSAPLKKTELVPDEETEVSVIFNSTRYKSRTSKGTIISSNDLLNRSVRVTFAANMDTTGLPFDIEPFGLQIAQGDKPPKKMEFEVKNNSEINYELELIDYTADVIQKPKIDRKELKAGKKTTVEVSLNDDYDYAANYIKASFTVKASGENPVIFTIPIKGAGPK
ncbi:DUF1573 domain-containing protein [bacterium]|nr:DUF1573 domain-containing protein [bacterium]